MNLRDYLASEGAMSVAELARRVGLENPAQVRAWQHEYYGRKPGPRYCVAIEQATAGAVRCWDLRPGDWHLIWPHLIGAEGAPAIPHAAGNSCGHDVKEARAA